jgi:CheY-like chemotaxis protein
LPPIDFLACNPDDDPLNLMRILVIEDNRIQSRIVERCLRTGGFEDFTTVASSEDALARLEEDDDYDLLIIDWMLPGVSGIDFVHALRSSESFHSIPIIMQTAKDRPEHVEKARKAGVNGYVVKPVLNCSSLVHQIKKVQAGSAL